MSEDLETTCTWPHLEQGLARTDLLRGILDEADHIAEITFRLPSGNIVTVPNGSKLEIRFRRGIE